MNDSTPPKIALETASAVVDALGGTSAVARLCGASLATVTNWRARGRLAPQFFLILQQALAAIGSSAPASLWGVDDPTFSASGSDQGSVKEGVNP